MDVAGTPLDRLVARLPGLAALCLDVGVGSVRLQQSDGSPYAPLRVPGSSG